MKKIILVMVMVLSANSWASITRKEFKLINKETLQRWDESEYEDKEYHNGESCQVILTKSWDIFGGSRDVDTMTVELDGKAFTFILDSVLKLGKKTFSKTKLEGVEKFQLKRTFINRYEQIKNQMSLYFSTKTGKLTDVKLTFMKGAFGTSTNFYTFVENTEYREELNCNLEWE